VSTETEPYDPHALLASSQLGILATIKRSGMPQLSPVTQHYDRDTGRVLISTRVGLAKTANLQRDPRAALEVTSADGRSWATAEGAVRLTGPSDDPHGPEVDALVEYFRLAAGEHPDWAEYRSVMVADQRVLITIDVDKVYGTRIG
jgi:PPOX class probable F420-dependent enzyme